jgi:hypothetical protein
MSDEDRELLMLLGSVGIRVGQIVTGLFEDSLSAEEQSAFGNQLRELAQGFHQRVRRTPLVLDGETTSAARVELPRKQRKHTQP